MCDTLVVPQRPWSEGHYWCADFLHTGVRVEGDIGTGPVLSLPVTTRSK